MRSCRDKWILNVAPLQPEHTLHPTPLAPNPLHWRKHAPKAPENKCHHTIFIPQNVPQKDRATQCPFLELCLGVSDPPPPHPPFTETVSHCCHTHLQCRLSGVSSVCNADDCNCLFARTDYLLLTAGPDHGTTGVCVHHGHGVLNMHLQQPHWVTLR